MKLATLMHLRPRPRIWLLALMTVVAGVMLAGPVRGGTDWSFQGEQVIVVREALTIGTSAPTSEVRSTARFLFLPGAGWRVEIDTAAEEFTGPNVTVSSRSPSARRRVFVTDLHTFWAYDPDTNRYTEQDAPPGLDDPRGLSSAFVGAGSRDFDSALEFITSWASGPVEVLGEEVIAGRTARQVQTPGACRTIVSASASAPTTPGGATVQTETTQTICGTHARYWLDAETGWLLRADVDNGGLGYSLDTLTADFDARIDPAHFRFRPPPGAVLVDDLN